jgi:hypothetical protein
LKTEQVTRSKDGNCHVGFEVLKVVSMKISVFWDSHLIAFAIFKVNVCGREREALHRSGNGS